MREIKFRAWDKEEKRMRSVVQVLWGSESNPYPLSVDFYDSIKPRLLEKVELMQYTGLKDKNGVEIYEGDILEKSYVESWGTKVVDRVVKVVWCAPVPPATECLSAGFSIVAVNEEPWQALEPLGSVGNPVKTFEVIGDIHSNPELIKEDK